jgi:photosystem II stability/assembly factor-like uncharacterized protein
MKKILATTVILFLFFVQNNLAQGWQWIDTGFPVHIFDMSFPSGQSDVGFAVGSTLTFGGDGIILKTNDGGSTWSKISADTIPGLKTVCFTSVDVGYAGGYQNFLMKTTDGGSTWTKIVIDSKLWYFNNIDFWDSDNGIVVSYPSVIYRTSNAGITWGPCFGLKHSVEDLCYADATTLYLVGGDERIYKSTNSGFFWTEIDSGAAFHTYRGVEFYNTNYGIVTGEDGKVLVTTNGGSDWIISNAGGSGLMRAAHIFNQQNSYVVGTPEQIYKTTDGGINWSSDFNGANNIALYKIKFTENNTGLICGSGGKFLMNTDYVVPVELTGFTAIVNGNDVQLNWTTKTELNNSGFEVLRSEDDQNWEKVAFIPGFGTTTEARNYSFSDEQLKGGSYSYRLKQIDYDGSFEYSDIVNVFVSIPEVFILEQNYPNPFNPGTLIKYQVSNTTPVSIKVYDLIGREVAILVNEVKETGVYQISFDGENLTSGIYFYKMIAGDFSSVKKMNLLK